MNNSFFVIECARPEEAAALLDYLKIIGRETDNLSFGAVGVPLSLEAEQDYLRSQCGSADNAQHFAKVDAKEARRLFGIGYSQTQHLARCTLT